MSDKVIFCVYCGQIAGRPTKCPVRSGRDHEFRTKNIGLWLCVYCGATIGTGTICPVRSGRDHEFRDKSS